MGDGVTDAVVIGAGPNGLSAAVRLAQAGVKVLVLEADDEIGGGTRTRELTLPGFLHDVCSAVHPMVALSPYLKTLPLDLRLLRSDVSIAHPLDDGDAMIVRKSLDATAAQFSDAEKYRALLAPFLPHVPDLLDMTLGPFPFLPKRPFLMARFGLQALRSAESLAEGFEDPRVRAVLAGCAAHSILPLDFLTTAALALMFLLTAHTDDWPVVEGGSHAITKALARLLESLGGRIETGKRITRFSDLPEARAYLFDTDPRQLATIAGDALPQGYRDRLNKYRYGPGVFKLDWALSGPIPWRDPRCARASTVHVGGTFEEIASSESAMWRGEHHQKPFVLLAQQSMLDPSRAPAGKHTGWAYCHVPSGSTADMTDAIELQVERFAPGFRDLILARHKMSSPWFEAYNPNYVGGAITGGAADLGQLFTRPVARINPYTTPNPRIFLCSAATPPGAGTHGMCGYHAAVAALDRFK